MPYQLFHALFPEVAAKETRSITVFDDDSGTGLPPGEYAFCEMFCDEQGCDCRRVFFYVMARGRQGPEAVIAWGWEPLDFYAKWLREGDPAMVEAVKGPSLNLGSPETRLAPALLAFVRDHLLRDDAYVERVKRHYRLFRAEIDGKTGPHSKRRKRKNKKKRKRKR